MKLWLRRLLGRPLRSTEIDQNTDELELRTGPGWKDLVSPLVSLSANGLSNQIPQPFGPGGDTEQYIVSLNDYFHIPPYHVNHDIKPGGNAYIHVHWSTDGMQTNTVKWRVDYTRAKGHGQEAFGNSQSLFIEQAASGIPWQHMVAEAAVPIVLTEPDELIIVSLHRISNGTVDNSDNIFGLLCDFHYEADRDSTVNRSPNFYG